MSPEPPTLETASADLARSAITAWMDKRVDDADRDLDRALEGLAADADGDDVSVVARACRVAFRTDVALEITTRAVTAGTATVESLLELARAHVALRRFDDAEETLTGALAACEPHQAVRVADELIRIKARNEDFDGARAVAFDYLKQFPNSKTLRWALAFVQQKERSAKSGDDFDQYWLKRCEYTYMHIARKMMGLLGASALTALDVGSNRTPVVMSFPARRRYSVDMGAPYHKQGVIGVSSDYLKWVAPEPINIASCLQVLEHIPDPAPFAQKLLADAEVVIASVPHMERPRANPGHLHSMISPETFASWFGRPPNFLYIARELSGDERMIGVWDRTTTEPYGDLSENGATIQHFRYRWSLRGSGIEDAFHKHQLETGRIPKKKRINQLRGKLALRTRLNAFFSRFRH